MTEPKVSIIIPVYKVEKYLSECISSVIAQTHKNLEIILIDDGSPDNCPDICDSFAKEDTRIRVIHKENGGAASARNAGLEVFTGDYVCLVDADDIVSPLYVERLLAAAVSHGAEAAVCSFKFFHPDTLRENPVSYPENSVLTQIDYLKLFLTDWTSGLATNKIFRRDTVINVRYAEGHKIDDEFFTYKAIINCKKVAVFNEALYLYRMRKSSVMSKAQEYQEQILLDRLAYSTERYRNVVSAYPCLKRDYLINLSDQLITFYREGGNYPKAMPVIKKTVRRYFFPIMLGNTDIRTKVAFIKALLFPAESRNEVLIRKTEHEYFE